MEVWVILYYKYGNNWIEGIFDSAKTATAYIDKHQLPMAHYKLMKIDVQTSQDT